MWWVSTVCTDLNDVLVYVCLYAWMVCECVNVCVGGCGYEYEVLSSYRGVRGGTGSSEHQLVYHSKTRSVCECVSVCACVIPVSTQVCVYVSLSHQYSELTNECASKMT